MSSHQSFHRLTDPLRKIAKSFLTFRDKTDKHIATNLAKFRNTIDDEIVHSTKRPTGYEEMLEIVIPCYNHGAYLKEAFGSILDQTHEGPVSVTLVNDHSLDNSLEIMKDIAASRYPSRISVKIIDNPTNINQGGSINRAIGNSKNMLFMALNADDLLTRDCIDLALTTYDLHPEIYMLGGSSLWFEDSSDLPRHDPRHISELELTVYRPEDALQFTRLNDLNMSQSSCSFFRVAWEAVGGYFERAQRVCSYDDRDFQMRVCSLFPVGVYRDYPMEFYRTISSMGRATI